MELPEFSAKRRRHTLIVLAVISAALMAALFVVNFESAPRGAVKLANSVVTSLPPTHQNQNTPQPAVAAAAIFAPPTFFDTLSAYVKLKVRLNWWSWLSTCCLVGLVVAAGVILWWSMPAGALLLNVNDIDPEPGLDPKELVEIMVEPEKQPIYTQPLFISSMAYFGFSLIFMILDFVVFRTEPFISFDTTSTPTKIISAMLIFPYYFSILPVYCLCVAMVGLFVKVGRVDTVPTTLRKTAVVLVYIISIPFQLVLLSLELLRVVMLAILTPFTKCCLDFILQAELTNLRALTFCLLKTPSLLVKFCTGDHAELKINCDAIANSQPLMSKLKAKLGIY